MRAPLAGLVTLALLGLGLPAADAVHTPDEAPAALAVGDVVVVASGDIACSAAGTTTRWTCRQAATARLARSLAPDAVLALGDLQYEVGALQAFQNSYDESWGTLRSITYPVPGNHEYETPGASGYYDYFGARAHGSPGYYAFELGAWQVYALNTNCSKIDCVAERQWLTDQLATDSHACSMFFMHHPRYSSGEHGGSVQAFGRIAYAHGVDVLLSGHDHDYERFRRMNSSGDLASDGFFQFVSGAGGKSLRPFERRAPGSAYRVDDRFGVLRLVLRADGFRYAFKAVGGETLDAGNHTCA